MTGSQTSNTSPNSLALNGGIVSATSLPIGLGGTSNLQLGFWIRRGDDSFSELPDAGEDLIIEFLNRDGAWIELGRFFGDGTGGQIYSPKYTLPASAAHAGFRIRVRMTGANLPWLRYDWPGDGNLDGLFGDDPQARATFGI